MVESVSILIPTHDRRDILARTLDSLAAVRVPAGVAADLTVVANACTDGTEAMVADKLPGLPMPGRCLVEPRPGVSVARNLGVRQTAGEVVVNIDDDVWLGPEWLEELLKVYDERPADLVGGRVELWWEAVERPAWVTPTVEGLLSRKSNGPVVKELHSGSDAIGANMSFRRSVYNAVGGFREGLDRTGRVLLGGGETDFMDRAVRAGLRLFYAPDCVVKHWVAPHRVGDKYLTDVSYQLGRSQVFAKDRFGPGPIVRCLAGRAGMVAGHGAGELWAKVRGDEAARVRHRLRRRIGAGGLAAAAQRLAGRSPVKSPVKSAEGGPT